MMSVFDELKECNILKLIWILSAFAKSDVTPQRDAILSNSEFQRRIYEEIAREFWVSLEKVMLLHFATFCIYAIILCYFPIILASKKFLLSIEYHRRNSTTNATQWRSEIEPNSDGDDHYGSSSLFDLGSSFLHSVVSGVIISSSIQHLFPRAMTKAS
jgi:hypothetical protein